MESYVKNSVKAMQKLVNPIDQTEDIINCINFITGEPMVDTKRNGLWDTGLSSDLFQ